MTSALPTLVLCDFPAETHNPRFCSFSPFVLQVERALRLAKLPFRHDKVQFQKIKAINPTGQLPVLLIDGEALADSTRILHRIEALVPGSLSAGLDAVRLAEAWLWEEFSDTALYPHVVAVRWADDRGWPVPRKAFFGGMPPVIRDVVASIARRGSKKMLHARDFTRAGSAAYEERFHGVLDLLDTRAPAQGFWMGDKPSVADLGLFAHLHQLRFPQPEFAAAEVSKRVRLCAWLDRVEAVTT